MSTTDILMKAIEGVVRAFKMSGATSVKIDLGKESEVVINGIPKARQLTNGEWLRGLSDEELVGKLDYEIVLGHSCDNIQCNDCEGCQNRVLAWLRAEHKEAE